MCSNNRNGVCGGRNAIAYDSDNCGCTANNACSSNNGCVNSAYDSDNGCNSCDSCNGGNVLCSAASGFASTVFRVVRGLDRSISGCGCGNSNGCGNNNGCGCGNNNGCVNNNGCGCGCN